MYLLDTNIISALAPMRAERVELRAWIEQAGEFLHLSVVSVAEITHGIAKAKRMGAQRKAALLLEWWEGMEHLYGERILAFDMRAAHAAGAILDRSRGHDPGFEDVAIAAIAEVHGLTILTANERHFGPLGVQMANPFKTLPPLQGR